RHGGVAGGEAGGAGAEDEPGAQEVPAPELVDPDRVCHRSCTYLSWNSGDANARSQRARSSAAALRRAAVWGRRTLSTWAGAWAPAGRRRSCPSAAVTKLTRATTALDEIHASLLGHPPTSGGSNSTWPRPGADCTASRDSWRPSSAFSTWTMNSVGDLTSAR